MSFRTSAIVWEYSGHRGSELLVLLAIADFADDDGRAYPAVPTLAAKCRATPRHTNRILAALRDSGELEIRINEGPRGTNLYRVALEVLRGGKRGLPLTRVSPLTDSSPLTGLSPTPDRAVPKPLTRVSDEPSLNRQEQKSKRADKPLLLPIPDDFRLSLKVQVWADEKGFGSLPERLEHFIDWARGGDKRYADWNAVFRRAVREDWAKLRGPSTVDKRFADAV